MSRPSCPPARTLVVSVAAALLTACATSEPLPIQKDAIGTSNARVSPCKSDAVPYRPRAAYSGPKPALPAAPTLATRAVKAGAAFTVFGAMSTLRSPHRKKTIKDRELSIHGHVALDRDGSLPPCSDGWPKGDGACSFVLAEPGASSGVVVVVQSVSPLPGRAPAVGDALTVTGQYGTALATKRVARFDRLTGILAATAISEAKP